VEYPLEQAVPLITSFTKEFYLELSGQLFDYEEGLCGLSNKLVNMEKINLSVGDPAHLTQKRALVNDANYLIIKTNELSLNYCFSQFRIDNDPEYNLLIRDHEMTFIQ
jgi:hypothetical protein